MNSLPKAKLFVFILTLFIAWSPVALAGGGPGSGLCFQVQNPSAGAISLKATIAVVFTPAGQETEAQVDAILRIQRGSDQAFFRINITDVNILGFSDELIAAYILNPCVYGPLSDNKDTVIELVNAITDYFFGAAPDSMELVLTSRSISDTDLNEDELARNIPGTNRAGSVADVLIYAIDKRVP